MGRPRKHQEATLIAPLGAPDWPDFSALETELATQLDAEAVQQVEDAISTEAIDVTEVVESADIPENTESIVEATGTVATEDHTITFIPDAELTLEEDEITLFTDGISFPITYWKNHQSITKTFSAPDFTITVPKDVAEFLLENKPVRK